MKKGSGQPMTPFMMSGENSESPAWVDAGPAGGEIVYAGGTLLDLNRYELYYQFDFTAKHEITEEDTRQAEDVNALPDLSLLSIDVDYIDPGTGPDGDFEHHLEMRFPQK
ncbi:hypothetical protein ECZC03_48600 [Escherichia coli]|nr:hypothetical protein ECZC03_48600 [Escherichia coli]